MQYNYTKPKSEVHTMYKLYGDGGSDEVLDNKGSIVKLG